MTRARVLWGVRYALPAVICLAGLGFLIADPGANFEGAMALIGAGLSVLLVNEGLGWDTIGAELQRRR